MPVFSHRVLITTAGAVPGVQDDDTGAYTPDAGGGTATVYDGKGLYLDGGVAVEKDTAGIPTLMADGQVVLPKKAVGKFNVSEGQHVRVTYPDGDTVDATVLRAQRFTDIVFVERA